MNPIVQQQAEKYKPLHAGTAEYIDVEGLHRPSNSLFDGANIRKVMAKFEEIAKKRESFTVLDYGCGKAKHLYQPHLKHGNDNNTWHQLFAGKCQCYYAYDPGYSRYSFPPHPLQLFNYVLCCDVMEHIPEEGVDDVLDDINSHISAGGAAFFTISGNPANKRFADGENLHCTVHDTAWWIDKLSAHMTHDYYVVVSEGDFNNDLFVPYASL